MTQKVKASFAECWEQAACPALIEGTEPRNKNHGSRDRAVKWRSLRGEKRNLAHSLGPQIEALWAGRITDFSLPVGGEANAGRRRGLGGVGGGGDTGQEAKMRKLSPVLSTSEPFSAAWTGIKDLNDSFPVPKPSLWLPVELDN